MGWLGGRIAGVCRVSGNKASKLVTDNGSVKSLLVATSLSVKNTGRLRAGA